MSTKNASNNASGSLTIDPGASGDSYIQLDINTTGEFRIGVDDTDDSFRISQGSALGTNDCLSISANGEVINPLTPAFGIQATDAADVTGAGTFYTIVSSTECFDQSCDFDGTSTFTAPVTGRYMFNYCITFSGIGSEPYAQCRLTTSNKIFANHIISASAIKDASNRFCIRASAITDMDAADTAILQAYVWSTGSDTVDILGSGTFFSGYLVC